MLNLYKKIGETPLECLNRFRIFNPAYKNTTLSYAGRLDPMAEGVLLVMEGDENKRRDTYLNFDKEYETEIVFGVSTDTFDLLGLVSSCVGSAFDASYAHTLIDGMPRSFDQEYPPYSSKTVGGVPLFELARKGVSFILPKKHVSLSRSTVLSVRSLSSLELLNCVEGKIALVTGDFRQEAIGARWREVLSKEYSFVVLKLSLVASSGFYVRTFADVLGKKVGCGATVLSIKRMRAGTYTVGDSLVF